MINLIKNLPEVNDLSAELVKIKNTFNCYSDIALFWHQQGNGTLISMLDGNMVIYNKNADLEELSEFIKVINPKSIFTDKITADSLNLSGNEAYVGIKRYENIPEIKSDNLSSREIYDLLNVDGLSLPVYEDFAVDICRKLNHNFANYFAIKDKCIAVALLSEDMFLLNGIASHEKGYGTKALSGLFSKNHNKICLACFEEKVKGFYIKNGFEIKYKVTYWVG